ncbi:nucleotidyltransferase family protein [Mycolicibacterium neoaurum]|mgnify:FL=1|jgi:nicotine blue oxidoreductase|uniref:nucleotidyltransferase family protein n=1 Tax=Mycolicibacterium neoaurum TaxID=1795 RepID=UPI001F4C8099|nr:nucleotidyltransferase family protein [Mycolicibacterium neoaurum]
MALRCSAGVVLAAGAGARFGMPKVLAAEGTWLAAAVTALLDGGCDEVLVVLGAARASVPAPAHPVLAPDWAQGLSASLRAGLAAASRYDVDHVVITLVDTPDVGADVVRRVLDAAAGSTSGLARAVFGGRPGHPVVIAERHWPALIEQLDGDVGAGPFLRSRDDVIEVECGDLATGTDIDVVQRKV